jgi:hypothetical protein
MLKHKVTNLYKIKGVVKKQPISIGGKGGYLANCSYFSQTLQQRRPTIEDTSVKTDICCMCLCYSPIVKFETVFKFINCQFVRLCNVYKNNLIFFSYCRILFITSPDDENGVYIGVDV